MIELFDGRRPLTQRETSLVLRAYTAAQQCVLDDVRAGRTPESLPTVGVTPRARRCLITARQIAKDTDTPLSTAARVWALYTAAILADEGGVVAELLADLEGADDTDDAVPVVSFARRRRRGARRCTPGGRPCAVVAERAASNAPPVVDLVERMNAANT